MAEFANVKKEDCLQKAMPKGAKLNGSHTLVLQSVINAIKEHGRSSMHKEVCGVLVGNLCWDKGPYLMIDARIEGKYADHQAGSVTFTSETWNYIHSVLAEKYPKKRIVGWYHTHPGFGIFLSNMDVFIHENFFSMRWQPAYVFDPQAETEGFFFWNKEQLLQETVPVVLDESPKTAAPSIKKSSEKISVVLTEKDEAAGNKRLLNNKLKSLLFALLVVIVILDFCLLLILFKETRSQRNEISRLKGETSSQSDEIFRLKGHNREQQGKMLLLEGQIDRFPGQLKNQEDNSSAVIDGLRDELANVKEQYGELVKKWKNDNDAVIAGLRSELAKVNEQYGELVKKWKNDSDNLISLRDKIQDLEAQLKTEKEKRIAEAEPRANSEKTAAAEPAAEPTADAENPPAAENAAEAETEVKQGKLKWYNPLSWFMLR